MPRRKSALEHHLSVQTNQNRRAARRRRAPKPEWDSKTGTLSYQGAPVLVVTRPSCFQWMIIEAFAEAGWPEHIENPLLETEGYTPERLTQTVKDLNGRQKAVRLRFRIDTDRRSLRWEWVGE